VVQLINRLFTSGVGARIARMCAFVLGAVFCLSSVPKVFDPFGFFRDVLAYQFGPSWVSIVIAVLLPFLELTIALLLLINVQARVALSLTLLLLVGFITVQGWILFHGAVVPCGCFSFGDDETQHVSLVTLVRTSVLLLLALASLRWMPTPETE